MAVIFEKEEIQEIKAPFLKLAQSDKLYPFLIFTGLLKKHKTLMSLALCQYFLCENKKDQACGKCFHCLKIENKEHESLFFVQPEKSVISVEKIREVLKKVYLKNWSSYSFVIIEQAEKLNLYAMNSLLKTLEEMPEKTFFIFMTSQLNKIIPTLRSRAQIFRFPLISHKKSSWELKSLQALEASEDELNSLKNLRKNSLEILLSLIKDKEYFKFKDIKLEKNTSLKWIRFWLEMIRDCLFLDQKSYMIHEDYHKEYKFIKESFKESLIDLFLNTQLLERKLHMNQSLHLCFEAYFYQMKEIQK